MLEFFKYLTIGIILSISLSACEPTYEDMVENKELRDKILDECSKQGIDAVEEEKCTLAMKAKAEAFTRGLENIFKDPKESE